MAINRPKAHPQSYLLLLHLIQAGCLAVWVNLYTGALANLSPGPALTSLGLRNLWIGVVLLGVGGEIVTMVLRKRRVRVAESSAYARHLDIELKSQNQIVRLAVEGVRALRADIRVNGRFFRFVRKGSEDRLVKEHEIHVETVHMPAEYGLDYAIVGTDDLAICRAFTSGSPVYEDLSDRTPATYSPRIRDGIDPSQRWVVACPVFANGPHATPIGVCCLYSTQQVVRTERDKVQLLQVAIETAKCFESLHQMRPDSAEL